MGGGKGGSKAPPPIDPGKSMGEYLFGKSFSGSYEGITDPRLQERLIGAERTYRPQYTALELADIGVMARGIEAGAANPEYARLQNELAGLKAGQEYETMSSSERKAAIEASANNLFPRREGSRGRGRSKTGRYNKEQSEKRAAYIKAAGAGGQDRAARIAQIEAQMQGMSPTLEGTPGLFDLLEEQSTRAGALQREQYLSGLRGQAAGMGQQAYSMNRNLAGDIGNTILGRQSSAINLGGQMLGQAQQGAAGPMGPQLFDPNVGLNMALQQRGQDVTFAGMQAQADAASSAGMMGAIGSIGGAVAGGMLAGPAGAAAGSSIGSCWVAREVYGIESGKWMQFREWMLNDSPSWFRKLYLKYGERFAKFISNKPRIKSIIRNWMNTKIK